jgi:hypothetical protein
MIDAGQAAVGWGAPLVLSATLFQGPMVAKEPLRLVDKYRPMPRTLPDVLQTAQT